MKQLDTYNALSAPQSAREQEALVFRLAARRMRDAADKRSRNAALGINHEVWSHMFRDLNCLENRLPPVLKRDCMVLARWSIDYSTRALVNDLELDPLIEINESVADGLSRTSAAPSGTSAPWTPALA